MSARLIAAEYDRQERLKKEREADEALAKMLAEEDAKNEQRRREKDEQENSCTICYEPLFNYKDSIFEFARLRNCNCVLHVSCLRPSVEAQLNQNILEFTCPNQDCLKVISASDLNEFMT